MNTILVIEDDLSIRETLKEALSSEGFHVLTAGNGEEGLTLMRQSPRPSLVLLDMMMPIMNGRAFLDAVMADVVLAPIPVVVMSATADESTSRGARAFIKKPPDLDLLLQLIHRYIPH